MAAQEELNYKPEHTSHEPGIGRSLLTKILGERRRIIISDIITLATQRSVYGAIDHTEDPSPQDLRRPS